MLESMLEGPCSWLMTKKRAPGDPGLDQRKTKTVFPHTIRPGAPYLDKKAHFFGGGPFSIFNDDLRNRKGHSLRSYIRIQSSFVNQNVHFPKS